MKRIARLLLRACLVLVILLAVLAIAALDGVDHRPYLREPYYRATAARLDTTLATNHLAHGELSAGFGRARLSPSLNAPQDDPVHGVFRALPLAGYGNRHGKPATGVHDDLYVKAVAVRVRDRTAVMVGADALIIPPEVAGAAASRLAQERNLSREQLYLSATHTHSSLGGWGEGMAGEAFAGGFQPGVRVWFADRIVSAVQDALDDLKPASFGHGAFAATNLVRNRLVGRLGRVDPDFVYAVLKQQQGKLGVLGTYAAHATVLGGDSMEFSADYPGAWQRAVEETTGGLAVFLAGGVGSHSPVPGEGGFAGVDAMGRKLVTALLGQLPHLALTNEITFGVIGLDVALPALNTRISDGLRLRPWLAQRLLRAPDHVFLQALRLDDLLWISTPCDFSGELALDLKELFRARGLSAAITSFNGGYVGYVIPSRYYHLDGYEPRLMSFFGPNVPDYFDEMIRRLGLSLADN